MIRYLHLSDLHLTSEKNKGPVEDFNQQVVTRSMVEMIRESVSDIDFVIITGDIARMGKPEEYAVCEVFCSKLLAAVNLEPDRLFLVPGNHDVDRGKVTKKQIKSVYSFESQDDITETITDEDFFPILMRKFEAFNAFSETAMGRRRFDAESYWYAEHLVLRKSPGGYGINLVGLNSCLFAGYDGDEDRNLALGLYQVDAALENLEKADADLSICFFHHPFACFHPEDKVCRNQLMHRFDLILTGHLHDPSNAFTQDAAGQAVIIGAGAGFETRESRNSFNVVEIDPETRAGHVQFFKYLPDHNRWKRDTDVNPDSDDGSFSFHLSGADTGARPSAGGGDSGGARSTTNISGGQVGVMGNHVHVDGGIHFHGGVGGKGPISDVSDDSSKSFRKDLEKFYLKRLINRCESLELAAIEDSCLRDAEDARSISVSDVFTTLYLKDITRREDQSVADAIESRLRREDQSRESSKEIDREERKKQLPIHATEAVHALHRMVILGQPGGGKSTLVNHMAAQLARRRADNPEALSLQGWDTATPPLPIRVILRQFAAWLNEGRRKDPEGLVWEYLRHLFEEWECAEYFQHARSILDNEGGVIFFDGLDEVSEADEEKKRIRILEAVRAFSKSLPNCRFLVTCREYAYRKKDVWRLPETEFPVFEMDLFRDSQIEAFAHAWFRVTGGNKGRTLEESKREAGDLVSAIKTMPHLRDLAPSPLLLTLMAIVHGSKGLPQDRADLYERAVSLLLAHWENRIVREASGGCRVEPSVIVKLGLKVHALREPLEAIALMAHEHQESDEENRDGCADIPREDLRKELAPKLKGSLDRAEEVIDYIEHRAGLLQAKDNRTFAFPHRTFQEYLAATGAMRRSDFEVFLRDRIYRDISWWKEVFLLAAGASSRITPKNIYDLVDTLVPDDACAEVVTSATIRYVRLAAQAMGETDFLRHVAAESPPGRYTKIHKRIQNWLIIGINADGDLPAAERCGAGDALNWVGDPRFNPELFHLPKDEHLGFVRIPAGDFLMGSDRNKDKDADEDEIPQHTVHLTEYWISRYAVTVAQFRAFVEKSGQRPKDENSLRGTGNQPVVLVSWHAAVAYCAWLTDVLKDHENTPEYLVSLLQKGWRITLPSEAEWEKAARGTDGRIYPWGDKADPNKANYHNTGIGGTSAVGCFPGGESPFRLLDASGNVWEWCQDWFDKDYYKTSPRNEPKGPEDGASRVSRGGSWDGDAEYCRAACRDRFDPGYRIPRPRLPACPAPRSGAGPVGRQRMRRETQVDSGVVGPSRSRTDHT